MLRRSRKYSARFSQARKSICAARFGLRTSDLGGNIACLLWSADRTLFHLTSEAFMFTFPAMKGWHGFALLLLTIQVPAFAEGIDLQNTRSFHGGPINNETVGQLTVKWVYQTAPDTGTANNAQGSISSTPAVDGPYLYFNDMSGYLTKLNRFTGKLIWRKNYVSDLSVPGFVVKGSRNTPYVKGDLIIVGSNMGLVDRLCRMLPPGATPSALGCASRDGAIVLAIDKQTGQVVWRTKAETHPSAKITGSISGHDNTIFVPVGNWEEDWSRAYPNIYVEPIDPASHYPCCSARGSLVAMEVDTGRIRWKRHTNIGDDPDHELPQELRALLQPKGSFGTSTYGHNPTVDAARRQVYIATAQTTTAPQVAQDCEQARRRSGDPNANIPGLPAGVNCRSEEHTSELQSPVHLVCRLLLEKKKNTPRFRRGGQQNIRETRCSR